MSYSVSSPCETFHVSVCTCFATNYTECNYNDNDVHFASYRLAALGVSGDGDGADGGVAHIGLLGDLDVRPRSLLDTFDRGPAPANHEAHLKERNVC